MEGKHVEKHGFPMKIECFHVWCSTSILVYPRVHDNNWYAKATLYSFQKDRPRVCRNDKGCHGFEPILRTVIPISGWQPYWASLSNMYLGHVQNLVQIIQIYSDNIRYLILGTSDVLDLWKIPKESCPYVGLSPKSWVPNIILLNSEQSSHGLRHKQN